MNIMEKNACTFIASNLTDFCFGYDTDDPRCIALKLQLAHYIDDMYTNGVRDFYSVCQEGVDLWAAEIVSYIMKDDGDVTLHCLIPYEEQAAKWHPDTRELYYKVLAAATSTETLSPLFTEDCLAAARYETLDHCDRVFAIVKEGGENTFVKYAKARGKNVSVIL